MSVLSNMNEISVIINVVLLLVVLILAIGITYKSQMKNGIKGAMDNVFFGLISILGIILIQKHLHIELIFLYGYLTIMILFIIANGILFTTAKSKY